jgi:hypothetical protein
MAVQEGDRLLAPFQPALFVADAALQDLVLQGALAIQRSGKIPCFDHAIRCQAIGMQGAMVFEFGNQCAGIAEGGAAQLHHQAVAYALRLDGLRHPARDLTATGAADRVELAVRSGLAGLHLAGNPAGFLHARQDPVDLLVRRMPEIADRAVETARQFVTRTGLLKQGYQQGMVQRHARKILCNELQCKPLHRAIFRA